MRVIKSQSLLRPTLRPKSIKIKMSKFSGLYCFKHWPLILTTLKVTFEFPRHFRLQTMQPDEIAPYHVHWTVLIYLNDTFYNEIESCCCLVCPVTISMSQVITRNEKATKLSANLPTWTSIQNKPSNPYKISSHSSKETVYGRSKWIPTAMHWMQW